MVIHFVGHVGLGAMGQGGKGRLQTHAQMQITGVSKNIGPKLGNDGNDREKQQNS